MPVRAYSAPTRGVITEIRKGANSNERGRVQRWKPKRRATVAQILAHHKEA